MKELMPKKGNRFFRILLIITLPIISVFIIGISYLLLTVSVPDIKEERRKEVLRKTCSEMTEWKNDTLLKVPFENAVVKLKTKYSKEERVLYQLVIDGYPSIFESIIKADDRQSKLLLHLYDGDGFVVSDVDIHIKTLTQLINDNGETSGLQINSWFGLTLEDYAKIKNVDVGWSILKKHY